MNSAFIYFSIPGIFTNFSVNKLIIDLYKNRPYIFNENIKPDCVYGSFFGNVWGLERFADSRIDLKRIKKILNYYKENSIKIQFEINNPLVSEKHLNNKLCNYMVDLCSDFNLSVVVNSNILLNHIKEHYPNVNIFTEKKEIQAEKRLIDISQIQAEGINSNYEKYELILNDFCECVKNERERHIEYLAKEQLVGKKVTPYYPCKMQFDCSYKSVQKHKNFVNFDELYNYNKIGFNRFRIQSASYLKFLSPYCTIDDLIYFYIYYLIKQEYQKYLKKALLNRQKVR